MSKPRGCRVLNKSPSGSQRGPPSQGSSRILQEEGLTIHKNIQWTLVWEGGSQEPEESRSPGWKPGLCLSLCTKKGGGASRGGRYLWEGALRLCFLVTLCCRFPFFW